MTSSGSAHRGGLLLGSRVQSARSGPRCEGATNRTNQPFQQRLELSQSVGLADILTPERELPCLLERWNF